MSLTEVALRDAVWKSSSLSAKFLCNSAAHLFYFELVQLPSVAKNGMRRAIKRKKERGETFLIL